MGDRGNIVVREDGKDVFLYTHWGGTEIVDVVLAALKKKWRWDDGPYLTRIIYDVLVGDQAGTETGYGISTAICDNEHDLILVDVDKGEVRMLKEGEARLAPTKQTASATYTFEEFLECGEAVSVAFKEGGKYPKAGAKPKKKELDGQVPPAKED